MAPLAAMLCAAFLAAGCGSRADASRGDASGSDISQSDVSHMSATSRAGAAAAGEGTPVKLAAAGRMRLVNGANTPDALIRSALAALAAGDTVALQRLLVTHDEFVNTIYPELGMHYPAAKDLRPQTREFIWENQNMHATMGLRHALREMGGRHIELLGITYADGGMKYSTYSIYEGTRAHVRMDDGREAIIHAFGSVVEMDGVYKLLTYRDRE
jgi:hypothetical protein